MGRMQDAMRRAAVEESVSARQATATSPLPDEQFPPEPAAGTDADGAVGLEAEPESPAPATPIDTDELRSATGEAGEADEAGSTVIGPDEPAATDGPLAHFDPSLVAKVVVDAKMAPASREQYRRLAAVLHHAQEANGLKVVMIASAAAGEGKSLTAANLALTLSESYRRTVLLIDGDLRRPALHTFFGLESGPGLSEALDSPDESSLTLYDLSPRLTLMPAGRPTSDPMAGLTSVRMRALIAEARERFGWVIIDTPPVGVLSDANLLSAMVDGVLLIIKADSTPYQLVQRAVETLGAERVLGTVLNRVSEASLHSTYGYYYSYYASPRADAGAG